MLRTVEGSKLLSLMKENGGLPRFTLPTPIYTRAGELLLVLAIVGDVDESKSSNAIAHAR